ncbi:MAG: 4-hydroxy-tetrahydrodipicolinate synthase [Deltaproteobacteria bacterium]|nr:4-hydroxy-tetrahydrodipicolinate synthase [Deltaproteobacteria bacterium]
MKELGRLLTAMVTPFDEKGAVNYEQAKKLALALLESGSGGVVVAATTGESPTLVREEEARLFTEVKSALGGRGTIIACTGSNSTAEAVSATKAAEKIGVDACLSVVPYYNKPTQEGIYQHFKTIAENTSLPIIMYNIPSRVVIKMTVETIVRLSRIDNIVGVKEASGDMGLVAHTLNNASKDFRIWSGNDNDTFHIMALGGYGTIGVATHLVGRQIKQMMDYILNSKIAEAAAIHRHLLPLVDTLFIEPNPAPIKYALNHLGFKVGKPRLPLVEPTEKSAAFIRETLKKYKIDLPV